MKKILTTAILCAGLVGFTSCDSFLEENPKVVFDLWILITRQAQISSRMSIIYIAQVLLIKWVA